MQSGWFVSKHLSAYLAPVSSVYTDIIGGMLTVSKFVSTHNTTLYQERLIIVLGTHAVPGLAGLYLHRYLLSLLRVFTELFAYNSSYESSYARLIKFSKDSLGLRLFLCCGAGGREVSISTLTDTMNVMITQWTLVIVFPVFILCRTWFCILLGSSQYTASGTWSLQRYTCTHGHQCNY